MEKPRIYDVCRAAMKADESLAEIKSGVGYVGYAHTTPRRRHEPGILLTIEKRWLARWFRMFPESDRPAAAALHLSRTLTLLRAGISWPSILRMNSDSPFRTPEEFSRELSAAIARRNEAIRRQSDRTRRRESRRAAK